MVDSRSVGCTRIVQDCKYELITKSRPICQYKKGFKVWRLFKSHVLTPVRSTTPDSLSANQPLF